jgi:hypothetical protein
LLKRNFSSQFFAQSLKTFQFFPNWKVFRVCGLQIFHFNEIKKNVLFALCKMRLYRGHTKCIQLREFEIRFLRPIVASPFLSHPSECCESLQINTDESRHTRSVRPESSKHHPFLIMSVNKVVKSNDRYSHHSDQKDENSIP